MLIATGLLFYPTDRTAFESQFYFNGGCHTTSMRIVMPYILRYLVLSKVIVFSNVTDLLFLVFYEDSDFCMLVVLYKVI